MSDIDITIVSKVCTQCGEDKPITNFYKSPTGKDGFKTQCSKCYNSNRISYRKEYYEENKEKLFADRKEWNAENKELISERNRAWYDANKEYKAEYDKMRRDKNKEAISIKRKEWNDAHKEHNREVQRIYREKNREKTAANLKKWCKANPERRAVHYRTKRAMRNSAPGSHTANDILNLFALQKKKCACCLKSIKNGYHVDHVIPLSRGGSNDKYNLQLLCAPCNLSKSAKDPIEFNQSLGLLL